MEELTVAMRGGQALAAASKSIVPAGGQAAGAPDEVRDLARGVNQLVTQMRAEQKVVREWVDEQASQQAEVASVLRDLAQSLIQKGK